MKRRWIASVAVVVLASVMSGSSSVLAAETAASTKSDATLTMEKNEGENGEDPVNPIDPQRPVTPAPGENGEENPHPPSTKGPLSINYISNLQFGKNKASGNDVVYQVKPDRVLDETGTVVEVPNFVQVTDHRGTNAGWTLFVKQDSAFSNGSNQLTGTELIFTNPYAIGKSGSTETAPTLNDQFTLTSSGQSVRVMVSEADHGMGTWVNRYGVDIEEAPASVTLKVPGNSKKAAGKYTTSLTWTLSDVPIDD